MEVTPVTTTVISTVTKNTLTASALPTEESTYPDTQSPSNPSSYLSPLNVQQLAGTPGNLLAFFPPKFRSTRNYDRWYGLREHYNKSVLYAYTN
jgi:hypothetical protein